MGREQAKTVIAGRRDQLIEMQGVVEKAVSRNKTQIAAIAYGPKRSLLYGHHRGSSALEAKIHMADLDVDRYELGLAVATIKKLLLKLEHVEVRMGGCL